MASELPVEIDCRRLLADGGVLDGTVSADRLTRIDGIFRAGGAASARLSLVSDESGRLVVSGSFRAPLEAQCQRCLEWMTLEVRGDFELDVLDREPSDEAVEHDDANLLAVSAGRLPVIELIEDELLLACPMVPAHNDNDCHPRPDGGDDVKTEQTRRPFAALAAMINAGQKSD